jgi:hypothetical protein
MPLSYGAVGPGGTPALVGAPLVPSLPGPPLLLLLLLLPLLPGEPPAPVSPALAAAGPEPADLLEQASPEPKRAEENTTERIVNR